MNKESMEVGTVEQEQLRRRKRPGKTVLLLTAVGILVLLAGGYLLGSWLENSGREADSLGDYNDRFRYSAMLKLDGQSYRQKGSVTTLLLMGIDQVSDEERKTPYRSGGQADFLRLLVIDRTEKTVVQIPIDRDTITPIRILTVLGEEDGTREDHISISHSFGDGKEQSGELTRRAVSELFLGARIDFWVAMSMDGIAAFNDMLGGVAVTLEDDLTQFDPAWQPGTTVILSGEQAFNYLHSRMSVGDGSNASRMRRQQAYISEAAKLLQIKAQDDADFVGRLFDSLTPYLSSNIGRANLVNLALLSRDFDRTLREIPGEHGRDADGFTAFYYDKDAVRQMALELLFTPME